MMAKLKTKSALSFFGSDSEVAGDLAALLNHCTHVTIPFVGGASIIPHLTARAIVANDLHGDAINFYRVVSGRMGPTAAQMLIAECEWTLSHPAEMRMAEDILASPTVVGSVSRAWAFWASCWIGRKGAGGTSRQGGMPSIRRTARGGTNASRLRSAANDLTAWAEHLARCEWESLDFRELLPKVADESGCGIYCDPPWPGAGDKYLYPFNPDDHTALSALLQRFTQTTVVVRYGNTQRVRDLYPQWHVIESASRDQCNAVKGELWFTNRHPARGNK